MDESRVKHLEFIQSNISRMNQNSFSIKGWMITILSALLALYAGNSNKIYVEIALLPTIVFWFLDAYYLQIERKFRRLYDDVAGITDIQSMREMKIFTMSIDQYKDINFCFISCLFSPTIMPLYVLIIVGLIIATIVL